MAELENEETMNCENGAAPESSASGKNGVQLLLMLELARMIRKQGTPDMQGGILSERRFVCAMDRAAACPDWWHVNRLHFYNPEMTHAEIGRLLGLKRETVTRWIRQAEIPEDDYEFLPCDHPL